MTIPIIIAQGTFDLLVLTFPFNSTNAFIYNAGEDELHDEVRNMSGSKQFMLPQLSNLIGGIAFARIDAEFVFMVTRINGDVYQVRSMRIMEIVHDDMYTVPAETMGSVSAERDMLMGYTGDDVDVAYSAFTDVYRTHGDGYWMKSLGYEGFVSPSTAIETIWDEGAFTSPVSNDNPVWGAVKALESVFQDNGGGDVDADSLLACEIEGLAALCERLPKQLRSLIADEDD